jgi:hypothetical protein
MSDQANPGSEPKDYGFKIYSHGPAPMSRPAESETLPPVPREPKSWTLLLLIVFALPLILAIGLGLVLGILSALSS